MCDVDSIMKGYENDVKEALIGLVEYVAKRRRNLDDNTVLLKTEYLAKTIDRYESAAAYLNKMRKGA